MKQSYITITDQFCGAGGSSQGAKKVLDRVGGEIRLALNHWKLAIETHNTNFPNTLHDCTDVSACDPRRYPSTDGLITSPECRTHTPAGGNHHRQVKKQLDMFERGEIDPATIRSRATMWDVCRFAEYHNYNFIVVENVVEAKTRWVLFDNWLSAMHTLGYNHKCVYLNSMHCHPTPQSRDRMYVIFWKKGNKAPNLDYTPKAFCPKCNKDVDSVQTWKNPSKQFGKYRQQYVYCCPGCTQIVEPYYYAALNIINWSNIGTRVKDRKKPLSPKTIARIRDGKKRYGRFPFVINDQFSEQARGIIRPVTGPVYTLTTAPRQLMVMPFIIKLEHGLKASSIFQENHTQTTHQSDMLVHNIRSTLEALQTQTTAQAMGVVIPPFITESYNDGKARKITDPLNTITAGGIKSGLVTSEAWNSFITTYNNIPVYKHFTEELPTISTTDRNALLTYNDSDDIGDCYYRMLTEFEVKLGMAFDPSYVIKGNARDQVKQCGNAVTPPAMELLVERCIQSLS
jgi:DNA (cytosine-5)-methyltransferase 1